MTVLGSAVGVAAAEHAYFCHRLLRSSDGDGSWARAGLGEDAAWRGLLGEKVEELEEEKVEELEEELELVGPHTKEAATINGGVS